VEARELGRSGVEVSRLILGCGNFGGIGSSPAFFGQGTSSDDAHRLLDAAWELGITTFDTADAYGGGRSESWLGDWLRAKPPEVRERIVVTTKTFNPMDEGADRGLSRARIHRQVETSLTRLGLDRIPLYMAHDRDLGVPQEETLQAFDELVRAGKVGAVGASNYSADALAEALEISRLEGLIRFEWAQNSFSLLEQADRQTVFALCHEYGIGYTPFGPLAGGWLTGKYRRNESPPAGSRMTKRPEPYADYATDRVFNALEKLAARASEHNVSMAALALAWLLHTPEISAVVVGPNTVAQLEPVAEASAIELSSAEHHELAGWFA
jgi:aryl-alcohol dehydrogenase-like predicted oxidoreductase